ncbi:MAG: alanine racemase [bacterium]
MLKHLYKYAGGLLHRSYIPLNRIEISNDALVFNHNALQSAHPNSAICPVLKSNAYGHGLKAMGAAFDRLDCPFLIVDSLYEAYELYKLHVKTPILILGYTDPHNYAVKPLPFHIALFDLETAKVLNTYQKQCNVHIFLDTGMSREGVTMNKLPMFLTGLVKLKNLNIVGICSHFADADNSKSQKFTLKQLVQFKKSIALCESYGYSFKWRHISASAGAFRVADPLFNMIRGGISHYGINPLAQNDKKYQTIALKPVLQFTSTLVQVKQIKKGDRVGYNCTFTAQQNMTVGLLPAGYYEGVDRRLSNRGVVTIRGITCPILGRISMNMTTIDISHLPHPHVGEIVVIFSSNSTDKNSIVHASETAKTIPYELLVHLAHTIKREIV